MLEFWRNPELVRHARAELRPSRIVTVGAVVAIVCALIALMCWNSTDANSLTRVHDSCVVYYRWIVILQAVLLLLWALSSCIQSIAREREMKTYDFLKTTRLTAGEIIVGKLLGVPIMAYFIVACSFPIAFVAGISGGYAITAILLTYLLLFVFALFLGLAGLWISMQMDKPQPGIGIVGLLFAVYMTSFVGMAIMSSTPFSGFAALSPLPALASLYPHEMDLDGRMAAPTVFGYAVPWIVVSLALYVLFGFWLALMLRRNLKKEADEVRMLSPWQALGFSVFLNALLYAFFNPAWYLRFEGNTNNQGWMHSQIYEVMLSLVLMNGGIVFFAGISTLTPHERLKVWWRRRKTGSAWFLAEDGLSWPWLLMAATIGYVFLVAYRWGGAVSADWNLKSAALLLSSLAIFAIRDVLFLQWCCLTRMKRPVQKGFLFLLLYYFAAAVIAGVAAAASMDAGYWALGLLTPLAELDSSTQITMRPIFSVALLGMALQIGAILLVYLAIAVRLNRAPRVATAEAV